MTALTSEPDAPPCPGPFAACTRSAVVQAFGVAIHYGGSVTCCSCGASVTIARYSPDAQPDPLGGRMGGHLCHKCDPLTPEASH